MAQKGGRITASGLRFAQEVISEKTPGLNPGVFSWGGRAQVNTSLTFGYFMLC